MTGHSAIFYRVNAFIKTGDKYALTSGNAAAVVLLTADEDVVVTDEDRQTLATEMNLSETAFVVKRGNGGGDDNGGEPEFGIRWFTPTAEVSLCGHATLAAGLAVLAAGWVSHGATIRFSSKSGVLTVYTEADVDANFGTGIGGDGDGDGDDDHGRRQPETAFMTLQFPLLCKREPLSSSDANTLLASLRLQAKSEVREAYRSTHDTVAILARCESVRKLAPDLQMLSTLRTRGVIVAAETEDTDERVRFVSRYFAPSLGINEDPVTGSAHCALAHYFLKHSGETVVAEQASERGGMIHVRRQDPIVMLGGHACVVVHGMVNF